MKKGKNKTFEDLPLRLVLMILNEFYSFDFTKLFIEYLLNYSAREGHIKHDQLILRRFRLPIVSFCYVWDDIIKQQKSNIEFNLKMFFGYFKRDRSNHIFDLFRSLKIQDEIPKEFNDIHNFILHRHIDLRNNNNTDIYAIPVTNLLLPQKLEYLSLIYSDEFNVNSYMLSKKIKTVSIYWNNGAIRRNSVLRLHEWLFLHTDININRFVIDFDLFLGLILQQDKDVTLYNCVVNVEGMSDCEKNYIKKTLKDIKFSKSAEILLFEDFEIGNIKFKKFSILCY